MLPSPLAHTPIIAAQHVAQPTGSTHVLSRIQVTSEDEAELTRHSPLLTITENYQRNSSDNDRDTGLYILFPPARGQPEASCVTLRHAENAARLIRLRTALAPSVPRAPPVS